MDIEKKRDVEVIIENKRIKTKAIIEEEKGLFNSEVKPGNIVRTKNDDRKIYTIKDVKSQNQGYDVKWGWKPDIYENPILNKFLDNNVYKVFAEEYIRFKYTMHHGPEPGLIVDCSKWYQIAYSNLATFYNIVYAKRMLDSINREFSLDRNNLHYLNSFFFFVMAVFDTLAEQINIICCDKDLGDKIYLHDFCVKGKFDKKIKNENYEKVSNYRELIENEEEYKYSKLKQLRNKMAHSASLAIREGKYLLKLAPIYGKENSDFKEKKFVKISKNRLVYGRVPRPDDYENEPIHEQCNEYFKGACSLCAEILKLLRGDYLKSQIYEKY